MLHSVWRLRDGMVWAVREGQTHRAQGMDGTVDARIWYICTRTRSKYRLKCELYSAHVGTGHGRYGGLDARYLAMGWRLS